MPPPHDHPADTEVRPERDRLALMRRTAGAMYVVGGVTSALSYFTVQGTEAQRAVQLVLGGVLVASGLFVLLACRSARSLLACAWWGILLLSVLVAVTDPSGRNEYYYLWPVVFAAYFFSRRAAGATYAWMVVSFAVALVVQPDNPIKGDMFVGAAVPVGLMAAIVKQLTDSESHLRAKLLTMAETDSLTGLLNRRSFHPRLERCLADAASDDRPVSIVMLDVDHFKQVNDDHGHLVGDAALAALACVLRAASRPEDLVCRFGGEEFAIGLPGCDLADASAFARRVAQELAATVVADHLILSVSAGISIRLPGDAGVDELLRRADEALYAAKRAGRGRSATFVDTVEVGEPFTPAAVADGTAPLRPLGDVACPATPADAAMTGDVTRSG